MATLTIELPTQKAQTVANLKRWAELLEDRELSRFEGRVETDRLGRVIKSPPPAPSHGSCQSEIVFQLRTILARGRVLTECPISTRDGVKAADVAWASRDCMQALGKRVCFPTAPETCLEVISPGNTPAEIREKTALYFEAGAHEVWLCDAKGGMTFLSRPGSRRPRNSILCPTFPKRIRLRWIQKGTWAAKQIRPRIPRAGPGV